jgi:hypothetical protein
MKEMSGDVARIGYEKFIENFSAKPERNSPVGKSRSRLENNVKMCLKKWAVEVWTGFT